MPRRRSRAARLALDQPALRVPTMTEKMFSQQDVDRIVERRLNRERRLLAERHARELREQAERYEKDIARLTRELERSLPARIREWFKRTHEGSAHAD